MDAGLVGAWCTGVAGIIAAAGVVLKIILTRPRIPVAEEVLQRLTELEEALLSWATWAHAARMVAAAAGIDLPTPPLDPAEKRHPRRLATSLTERTGTGPLPAQTGR